MSNLEMLNVAQTAKKYNVSNRSIYRWIRRGWIIAHRLPSGRLQIPNNQPWSRIRTMSQVS